MKNYNNRMEIELFNVEDVSELHGNHFLMYNPDHKEGDAWFYEYNDLQDALKDGVTVEELDKAIESGYIRVVGECEPWD